MGLLETLTSLPTWQLELLVIGLLLQGAVVAIFPEEVIILTLGVLWAQGKIGFLESLVTVQLGLLPANLAAVWIGAKLLRKQLSRRQRVQEALSLLHRYGIGLIVLTRFTPVVRGPVYFAAGSSGFGFKRFFLADYSASLVQIPLLLGLGRWIGANADSIESAYKTVGLVAGSALLLGIVLVFLRERKLIPLKRGGTKSAIGVI